MAGRRAAHVPTSIPLAALFRETAHRARRGGADGGSTSGRLAMLISLVSVPHRVARFLLVQRLGKETPGRVGLGVKAVPSLKRDSSQKPDSLP
jgi:hypothetical protein